VPVKRKLKTVVMRRVSHGVQQLV